MHSILSEREIEMKTLFTFFFIDNIFQRLMKKEHTVCAVMVHTGSCVANLCIRG